MNILVILRDAIASAQDLIITCTRFCAHDFCLSKNTCRRMTLLLLLFTSPAIALTVDTPLTDRTQEARAKALFNEIRCVVCQSEAIVDSPAEVARDMRRLIRKEIASGQSEENIKSMLVTQYGDKILMKPPIKNHLGLWLAPLLLLLGGAAFAWRKLFR